MAMEDQECAPGIDSLYCKLKIVTETCNVLSMLVNSEVEVLGQCAKCCRYTSIPMSSGGRRGMKRREPQFVSRATN